MKLFLILLLALPIAAAQSMPSTSNPAAQQHAAEPDLLAEIANRKPLSLNDLLSLARAHNPTLRMAQARIAESAGHGRQAALLPNPAIGYEGDQIRGGSYGGGEHGVFLQQTIPLGGKLGLRRDVYREQQRSDTLALAAQQQRIEADIESSFYTALALQQEIETRRQLHAIAADAAVTARQLANVGQADTPDILQSEVEEQQAALDTISAEHRYIAAFHQLAAQAGQPDLPLTRLAGNLSAATAPPPSIDVLIEQSPAVARADQAVRMAEARLRSERREIIPDLTLRAGEQWNGELVRVNPNIAAGPQSLASASIDIPLWNRNQGNVAAAQAAVDEARAEAQRVRLELRHDAAPIIERYTIATAQTARYQSDLLPRAQRAYELYRERYQQMAASYPQVLVSQRTLFELQLSYIRSLGELRESAARLHHFVLEGSLSPTSTP